MESVTYSSFPIYLATAVCLAIIVTSYFVGKRFRKR
jgi:hypothetical protein